MNAKTKKIIAAVCSAAAVCAAATVAIVLTAHGGPYKGKVTDNSGSPVSGVSVTDGRNVVKTDANGEFTLKGMKKTHFVTITTPSGYVTDKYYIPVDKDTESYNFVLTPSELTASREHTFLQVSDTEIGEGGTGEWLGHIKDTVQKENPAFLIHTGDICYPDGLKRHIQDMNTETMGCTVYYTIGNHDYVDGKYGEELYESLYGPVWYSFEVGNVHYVVTSFQNGSDYKSCYGQNERWRWLANDLANTDPDKKVVMFNHTMSPSDDYVLNCGGGKKLDLKEHNLIAWIFGHYHYNYIYEQNSVLNISAGRPDCGGIDSSASGTRIVHIGKDDSLTTEIRYYDSDNEFPTENAVWSTKLEGNVLFCDTVYDNGCIYTATVDEGYPRKCGVYCLDYNTGDIKWFYETENSIKNNVVIVNDNLLAMDAQGNTYCLNKTDGKLIWKQAAELGNALGTSSGICADEETVYVGASRVITAYSIADGTEKWSLNRDKGENSPSEFILAGDKLIVGSHWDALAAIDKNTGKQAWECESPEIRFRSSTPILIDDNTLLVADSNSVMKVDVSKGEITSQKAFDGYSFSSSGQPAVNGNTAYIPTANHGLIAYDMQKEEILWEAEVGEAIVCTPPYHGKGSKTVESTPVIVGDSVIFGAADGYVYEVNSSDGAVKAKHPVGSSVFGKVYTDNGSITAGAFGGYIVKF